MSAPFIGLGISRTPDKLYPATVNTTGLAEGAATVFDTSKVGGAVVAPAGAAAKGFAGLIASTLSVGGTTTSGLQYDLQRTGIGRGLLKAGEAVTVGDDLIIADTDGSLKAVGTADPAFIVGKAMQTLTAGATNYPIAVDLDASGPVYRT